MNGTLGTSKITSNTYKHYLRGGVRVSRCLFFWKKLCNVHINMYLCTHYGTELYLDCIFHHRFRDCFGETGVSGRL